MSSVGFGGQRARVPGRLEEEIVQSTNARDQTRKVGRYRRRNRRGIMRLPAHLVMMDLSVKTLFHLGDGPTENDPAPAAAG